MEKTYQNLWDMSSVIEDAPYVVQSSDINERGMKQAYMGPTCRSTTSSSSGSGSSSNSGSNSGASGRSIDKVMSS